MAASSSNTLENACASLSLADDDPEPITIEDTGITTIPDEQYLTLVGQFVTEKTIKFNVMRDTMASTWRPGKGVNIMEVSMNLYLFQFFHEVDMNRILDDGPWSFEQSLLVLKKLPPHTSPFNIQMKTADFWVQAHNLPMNFFTSKVSEIIGNTLGEFIMADKKNFEGGWKSFLRVRARIDITMPLRRKMKMKRIGGEAFWVDFRYERLPNFCFLCGLIGHTERYCQRMFDGVTDDTERLFGNWLRTAGRRPSTNYDNPWLISDASSTNGTFSQSNASRGMLRSEQNCRVVGVREHVADKDTLVGDGTVKVQKTSSGCVAQNSSNHVTPHLHKSPEENTGPVIVDQKCRRAELDALNGPINTIMTPVGMVQMGSKNGFGAGPGP